MLLLDLIRKHCFPSSDEVGQLLGGTLEQLTLRWLNFDKNPGLLQTIADFLQIDKTLFLLTFFGCRFSQQSYHILVDALWKNNTLRALNLSQSDFTNDDAEMFLHYLQGNVSIHFFSADDERVCEIKLQQILRNCSSRNRHLIPAVVRRASLYLIAARKNVATAGFLGWFPKEIVRMIAIKVWASRIDPLWLQALPEDVDETWDLWQLEINRTLTSDQLCVYPTKYCGIETDIIC